MSNGDCTRWAREYKNRAGLLAAWTRVSEGPRQRRWLLSVYTGVWVVRRLLKITRDYWRFWRSLKITGDYWRLGVEVVTQISLTLTIQVCNMFHNKGVLSSVMPSSSAIWAVTSQPHVCCSGPQYLHTWVGRQAVVCGWLNFKLHKNTTNWPAIVPTAPCCKLPQME